MHACCGCSQRQDEWRLSSGCRQWLSPHVLTLSHNLQSPDDVAFGIGQGVADGLVLDCGLAELHPLTCIASGSLTCRAARAMPTAWAAMPMRPPSVLDSAIFRPSPSCMAHGYSVKKVENCSCSFRWLNRSTMPERMPSLVDDRFDACFEQFGQLLGMES